MHGRWEQLGKEKLQENTKRTRQRGEWLLKYINTGIHARNVTRRVTAFLFNTESGAYQNSCPVASTHPLQDPAEKGEAQEDPSLSQRPTSALCLLGDAYPKSGSENSALKGL